MATHGEVRHDRFADPALSLERIQTPESAGCVEGFLNVHAVVEKVLEDMGLTDRLIGTAHHAVREPRRAVLQDHGRDDRVERTLARADAVRVAGLNAEAGAAVLQGDAGLRADLADTEGPVERVDEGAHIAPPVGDGEVDRVALVKAWGG